MWHMQKFGHWTWDCIFTPDTSDIPVSQDTTDSEILVSQAKTGIPTENPRWNDDNTKLLLTLYGDRKDTFFDPKFKKKNSVEWDNISVLGDGLPIHFHASVGEVEGTQYKTVKDNNNNTGRKRKEFPYTTQLDEILGERADVVPKITTATLEKRVPAVTSMSDDDSDGNTSTCSQSRPGTSKQGTGIKPFVTAELYNNCYIH